MPPRTLMNYFPSAPERALHLCVGLMKEERAGVCFARSPCSSWAPPPVCFPSSRATPGTLCLSFPTNELDVIESARGQQRQTPVKSERRESTTKRIACNHAILLFEEKIQLSRLLSWEMKGGTLPNALLWYTTEVGDVSEYVQCIVMSPRLQKQLFEFWNVRESQQGNRGLLKAVSARGNFPSMEPLLRPLLQAFIFLFAQSLSKKWCVSVCLRGCLADALADKLAALKGRGGGVEGQRWVPPNVLTLAVKVLQDKSRGTGGGPVWSLPRGRGPATQGGSRAELPHKVRLPLAICCRDAERGRE